MHKMCQIPHPDRRLCHLSTRAWPGYFNHCVYSRCTEILYRVRNSLIRSVANSHPAITWLILTLERSFEGRGEWGHPVEHDVLSTEIANFVCIFDQVVTTVQLYNLSYRVVKPASTITTYCTVSFLLLRLLRRTTTFDLERTVWNYCQAQTPQGQPGTLPRYSRRNLVQQ